MALLKVLCLTALAIVGAYAFDNMNGEYVISKTPNPTPGEFSTQWSEYKNEQGGVESFDVYVGPISHLYGQVWWKTVNGTIPSEIVERFKGKGMAIVGYEVDQVRRVGGKDISVPINMAYNHHHDAFIVGAGSKMERVPYDPNDLSISPMARADPNFMEIPVEHTKSPLGLPTSIHMAAGNGGEYRKSYHGFPSPVAYVVDSPESIHVLPMQIDTWNRDKMDINGGSKFVPGPLPKHSLAPNGTDAMYSGLLECPLTDRVQKTIKGGDGFNSTFSRVLGDTCKNVTATPHTCFDAAKALVNNMGNSSIVLKTAQGTSETLPSGCSLSFSSVTGALTAFFNTAKTKETCGAGVTSLVGKTESVVTLGMQVGNESTTITMTGPTGVWYGTGFYASTMEDAPYTIIVDGNGTVTERRLANHAAGTQLQTSVKVISNTVSGTMRTVVLARANKGITKDHANFSLEQLTIPFIAAVGSTPTLSLHKSKTAAMLNLWPAEATQSVCLCEHPASPFGSASGQIKYLPTGEQFGFVNYCEPQPRESILQNRNPTCDVRAYVGGLQVCKHMWTLLDADQGQPWPDQPLTYYQKYRFYFQEYTPKYHVVSVPRQGWGIAAAGGHAEYDVPKCAPGTPPEECKHMIWGVLTPSGDNLHLAAIHFHCHAPTCLAMEIWNNKTGELICRQEPIYGGTGKIDLPKFDEPGYILQPPCLWGYQPGLEPMPLASGVPFMIKAITNNTYGHHGEMAFPEVTLVPWNETTNRPQAGP